jgi:pyrimidine-nucleoside phosphorylase
LAVGKAVLALGGGREQKHERIDHSVGVEIHKKPGQAVATGAPLATIYHNQKGLETAQHLLEHAFFVVQHEVQTPPLILERLA